jgi:hypothetical protein
VSQTLLLRSTLTGVVPAERILAVGGPDRVLLFVIDYYLVNGVVFPFIVHRVPPSLSQMIVFG